MTNVTIQLTPETEHRLRQQASERGETLETYLRYLAEREAATDVREFTYRNYGNATPKREKV